MFKYLKHKLFDLVFGKPTNNLTVIRSTPLSQDGWDPLHASLESTHKEVEYDEQKKVFFVDVGPVPEAVVPVKKTKAPVAPKPKVATPKTKTRAGGKARATARAKTPVKKSASMRTREDSYNRSSDDFSTVAVIASYSSYDDTPSRSSSYDSSSSSSSSSDSFSSGGGDFGGGGSSGSFD